MQKKWIWATALLGVVALSSVIIYWFYFSKPASFPTNEQLIREINQILPEASASVIQDTVNADARHKFVPFISEEGNYGVSYWGWEKHKWQVVSVDTTGEPHVWKVKSDDPSTYHLVWNIHPDDQVSYLKFYFMRDRGFLVSNGVETYDPKIQMEKKVTLQEKTYGALKLPNEWVELMNSIIKIDSAKAPGVFFNIIPANNSLYFGWTPYDKLDQAAILNRSVNGSGYSTGEPIEFVRHLSPSEIESPLK
ncbi:hypothetical protein QNH20_01775 [Neobacillus sp. WH10]|uniref:hypothetical protein n=1 Tax=Neobacillus sp. WH10 TaxID=3047873 RepID=UPI0024C1B912|nr:hypothetical protein [Neobacillus sp. WH10]WHY77932.1 hypothetical protein QNH20_01775 [Neobacillus sp. WH10]